MIDLSEISGYPSDLDGMIISIFDAEPVSAQPKYVVDLACGDGRVLKRVCEVIEQKTLRGRMLDVAPIRAVGIIGNCGSSEDAAFPVENIDRLFVAGVSHEPDQVAAALCKCGIQDPENALYVFALGATGVEASPSGYDQGDVRSTAGSLLGRPKEWVGLVRKYGVIISGSHTRAQAAGGESCIFPAADTFLMQLAQGGLFPEPDSFHRYPKTRAAAGQTLGRFRGRDYRIRFAEERDLPTLVRLEVACWPHGLQMPAEILRDRLTMFREGQLVLETDVAVSGVVYSQRIEAAYFRGTTAFDIHHLHRLGGSIVQLLAINVLPEAQYHSYGDQLLEFMLQYCAVLPEVDTVVGITRCKDYAKHTEVPMERYIALRNERGRLVDTVLRFHEQHGATIADVVADYRPADTVNLGSGVLVKYDLHRRRRNEARVEDATSPVEADEDVGAFVVQAVTSILQNVAPDEIELTQPLFELGLDSADLLDLNERISGRFGVALEAAFFFEHNTCERIISRVGELARARTRLRTAEGTNAVKRESAARPNDTSAEPGGAEPARSGYRSIEDQTDVAVVGVSCLLPGGITDPEQFWQLLDEGRDAISRLPPWRWTWPLNIDPQGQHRGIDIGGFVQDIETFDAGFFRISPRDAAAMDPQQRILLQLSWACLEDAGQAPQSIAGSRTGVFVGASGSDYQLRLSKAQELIDGHFGLATSMAILANRLSYVYDLNGPSIQIDGACSSSLVALHEAARSITTGQCSQALVAGINVMCHPANSIAYYKAGMLAADGKCKTFDKSANGYVRGEGAIAVLLKPLQSAVREGNRIYGIIKGSATNHGGRAAGLTVPNPARQADLIEQACKAANVDPRSIGYVEAHGTGTSLGDPVEVRGLTEAFARLSVAGTDKDEGPYCGLGSVKTNIGHLEAAAGLAGLLKALLCIRHRKIPASLNFSELNPQISLVASPFYIAEQGRAWELRDGQQVRRAGVSSFGSGGTNAHVIVEEYVAAQRNAPRLADNHGPALVVLSARNESRLKAQVEQLVAAIDQRALQDADLEDLAYTLQVGRDAMESRLGVIANSIATLQAKLRDYLAGNTGIEDLYLGQVKQNRDAIAIFAEDEEFKDAVAKWMARGKHRKLLELWVRGLSFDWHGLYQGAKPRRVSLPTYPFARDRYWLEESVEERARPEAVVASGSGHFVLHPLLHRNTSDLRAQRFSTRLNGEEFFLRDHVVSGSRVLPGVAHLEMARAAVEAAAGVDEHDGIRLQRVVWLRPVAVGPDGLDLHIELSAADDGSIDYEIYSGSMGGGDAERMIHSRGRAIVGAIGGIGDVDVARLQETCDRPVSAEDCYARFAAQGLNYGPSCRGLVGVLADAGGGGQARALARLALPSGVAETLSDYVLHPSVMDAALQASAGLRAGGEGASRVPEQPSLPFALEEIVVISPSPARGVAWVRPSDGTLNKLDIDVCDEAGRVCVQLRGFSSRAANSELASADAEGEAGSSLAMLTPVWEVVAVEADASWPLPTDRVVIIGGTAMRQAALRRHYSEAHLLEIAPEAAAEIIGERLGALGSIDHIVWLAPEPQTASLQAALLLDNRVITDQQSGVLQCFRLIKATIALGYGGKALGWTVITTQAQAIRRHDSIDPTHASVHGLIGSMAKEHPNWRVRLVDLPLEQDWPLGEVLRLPADTQGKGWGYRDGEWYRHVLLPSDLPQAKGALYRHGGVYVVIGGAGGIGEAWSEYMIRHYQAQIVWIGRRPHDASIQSKQDCLAKLGPAPLYIEADATDRWALERAYARIKQEHAQLHGVIHSAIVLSDKSLARMEEASFRAVLAAKVDVSVRLAQVFCEDPLDFVLFFSSVLGFEMPAGQSNYAAGCTFKDAFAHALGLAWPCPVKVMDWGYWGNIGSVASADYRARMARSGFGSIEAEEGTAALEVLMAAPLSQLAFVKTTGPLGAWNDLGSEQLRVYRPELPSISAVLQAHPTPAAGELRDKRASAQAFDELAGRLLWTQLIAAGFPADERTNLAAIKAGLGLRDSYGRWLDESLSILTTRGYLRQDGEWYARGREAVAAADTSWQEWEACKGKWLADPAIAAQVNLVDTTLRALPGVLRGAVRATDVMFPNGSLTLVEGVYKDNPVADHFNEALAEKVVAFVEERLKQAPPERIRLLEVGAGTGGTSARVLARLKPYGKNIAEYRYTDLSQAFLTHAREAYGPEHPYLGYGILDVEKPIAGQGIDPGSYDVVIATNVLHATRNIRRTLRNVKATLRMNGLLLLNEIVSKGLFTHVTFGLLDGWWLPEDMALRLPGSPCLAAEMWRRVLEQEGFRSISYPAADAHALGQQIIVAESDGVVRQTSTQAHPPRTTERPALAERTTAVSHSTPGDLSVVEEGELFRKAQTSLLRAVSDLIKVKVEDLDLDSELSEYGFDSISFTALSQQLNQLYGLELMPTIFFEYPTLGDFASYLAEHHRVVLAAKFAPAAKPAVAEAGNAGAAAQLETRPRQMRRARSAAIKPVASEIAEEPARIAEQPATASFDGVAVIGMSGRFPMAEDVAALWRNLLEARDCIVEIPKARWDWRAIHGDPLKEAGKTNIKWGGFIDGIDEFDPLFFGISPREAELMDPQQRLMMIHIWKAIEDAGYSAASLSGSRTAILAGIGGSGYGRLIAQAGAAIDEYGVSGLLPSFGPNRVSYFLDWHGPSESIETACSSSLVAVHRAVQALANDSCGMAVAGGVNTLLTPDMHISLGKAGMLSVDGRCKAFSRYANGYVRGEGVGMLVLKKLSAAEQDGDHIYGVIRGSAENHGGRAQSLTAPNPKAQAELLKAAYERAGVDPRTVGYIEAHGTGTELGDPIEINGLKSAFRDLLEAGGGFADGPAYCGLGTVKSNIGHLELAAGVAGLIKVLLQLKHKTLVKSLHSEELNPYIQLEQSPFYIVREQRAWHAVKDAQGRELPRRAGVSSFGAGGSNAHVVIEEYVPPPRIAVPLSRPALVVLSAKNGERLKAQAEQLVADLERRGLGDDDLADVVYTLQVGREAMESRLALTAASMTELVSKLKAYVAGQGGIEELYLGEVRREKDTLALFAADEDMARIVEAWVEKGKYGKLLELWVKGLTFDWQRLYGDATPRRISLPTYPFARERYWIEQAAAGDLAVSEADREASNDLLMLTPVWEVVAGAAEANWPGPADRVVIVGGTAARQAAFRRYYPGGHQLEIAPEAAADVIGERLSALGAINHIVWLAPEPRVEALSDDRIIEDQQRGVLLCFRLIKALLTSGYGGKALGWTMITTQSQAIHRDERIDPTHASVHGLIGSMTKEHPNWRVRLVDLPSGEDWPLSEVLRLPADAQGKGWGYRNGEWYRRVLLPSDLPDVKGALYRHGGVYAVIGGAGGIATAWSEYMIRHYHAQIVWIGRRPHDAAIQNRQDELAKLGPAPLYIEANATDRSALERAYARIKQEHPQVHGVIHSVAVVSDESLARMEEAAFRAVLAAKVDVSVRLAQVFCEDQLDFVLFFSSGQSFATGRGLSNYAAGCTFKDAFAHALGLTWSCPVKVMNWGYWGSVGIGQGYEAKMSQAGLGTIEAEEGMVALEVLLAAPQSQLAFVKTTDLPEAWKDFFVPDDDGCRAELLRVYRSELPSTLATLQAHSARPAGGGLRVVRASLRGLDDMVSRLLWTQLMAAGFPSSERMTVAAIKTRLGLRDSYDRWLEESLGVLAEYGYVVHDGESYFAVGEAVPASDVSWQEWEARKSEWLRDPAIAAHVKLADTTLRALPGILRGAVRATDVIFPNGSLALVEGIYKDNPVADYCNETLAGKVVGFVEERLKLEPSARIRLLEIGAGTGGTSARVLAQLKPYGASIEEYRYTDLSHAFLLHAEDVYGPEHSYLSYGIFDVEKPIVGQRIDAGSYDVVIATNVLHATRNIRRTLRNAKATLRTNGLLLLNEIVSKNLFGHVTFGLLDGWWLSEDASLRLPGSPCLAAEMWRKVLEQEGFRSTFFATATADDLGQHVIVSESDGVVRQPQWIDATTAAIDAIPVDQSDIIESEPIAPESGTGASGREPSQDLIRAKCTSYLRDTVARVLRMPPQRIDFGEPLASYGIDSILATALANVLRETFSSITSTVMFEHQNLASLVDHLVDVERDVLIRIAGVREQGPVIDRTGGKARPSAIPPIDANVADRRSNKIKSDPQRMSAEIGALPSQRKDLAVIGMSGRYAGADDLEEFWLNLRESKNLITEIPRDRWDWRANFSSEKGKDGTIYTKWGGFIRDIDKFDPLFFRLSPRDAEGMDPQERLFLQEAYRAIEDAGYTPSTLCESRKVGVFVGVTNGYYPSNVQHWSVANRVSYLFEFRGPSLAVDTACSASLTALHLAAESLYTEASDCAVVGGVNLIVDPMHYQVLSGTMMLSLGDKLRAFGEGGDGFVGGEGVGAVILKPLAKAIADGDRIYGVIKSSAINHGGKTNGYTVPNPNAQKELVRAALTKAGVNAREVSYVEAHGTGTELGDPIEIRGLTQAFAQDTQERQFCAIGSVKSNIGHCESAAGIAGLTKVLLQMQHGVLVPSLHSEVLNPHIDFAGSAFVVQQRLAAWPRPVIESDGGRREVPRIAGISSFGAGGSNAHVIVEEYVPRGVERGHVAVNSSRPALVVLSAKNEERLKAQAEQLVADLERRSLIDDDLADVAYTLQVGREAMESRLALAVASMAELVSKLRGYLSNESELEELYRGEVRRERDALAVFAAEDMAQIVTTWIEQGKYSKLLELWVKGGGV